MPDTPEPLLPKWVGITNRVWIGATVGYACAMLACFGVDLAHGFSPRSLDYLQLAVWSALAAFLGFQADASARRALGAGRVVREFLAVIQAQQEVLDGRAQAHFHNAATGETEMVDLSKPTGPLN